MELQGMFVFCRRLFSNRDLFHRFVGQKLSYMTANDGISNLTNQVIDETVNQLILRKSLSKETLIKDYLCKSG